MIAIPVCLIFWCLWMKLIAIKSEMLTRNFSQQPSYTDKWPKVIIAEEYRAESTLSCASMCRPYCSCFGYQHSTKTCRVFDFCGSQDTGNETGWVYYKTPTECDGNWMAYNGHYYILNQTKLSQPDAISECKKCGSFLVEINDEDENKWIEKHLLKDVYCTDKYDCSSWTGGNDIDTEGQFVWGHSITPFTFTNWEPYNPDDIYYQIKIRDCVDIFYDGQWNDRPCDFLANFICEK
ncbi:perlucin-like protein [Crassostrea angulata]|uniref:perlucin-like protein n=1 Tax=Magallana angulata TaxID=2784310 RepID=UPI0022B15D0E|nr:perlucin-like protein [Crassostrea angulata]